MPSLRAPCAMQHALSSHGCALLVCICRYREKHWFKRAWQHNSDAQAFTEVKERLDRAILDLHFGIQVDQRADQQRWEQVRVCHRRTCSNSMPLAMSTRTPSTQRAAESTVITHARSHARTHTRTLWPTPKRYAPRRISYCVRAHSVRLRAACAPVSGSSVSGVLYHRHRGLFLSAYRGVGVAGAKGRPGRHREGAE